MLDKIFSFDNFVEAIHMVNSGDHEKHMYGNELLTDLLKRDRETYSRYQEKMRRQFRLQRGLKG